MRHRRLAVVIVVGVLSLTSRATADVLFPTDFPLHISSNSSLRTDTNPQDEVRLPPGTFFDEPTLTALDAELRRLQEQEVRLAAENATLRDASRTWFPAWTVLAAGIAVGVAGGIYIGIKLN